MRLWNRTTGEVRLVPCRRLRCVPCLRRAAWRRALAINYAAPERVLTFTQVGDDWPTIRGRMYRLHHDLVRGLGRCEWVWNVERNPRGTGHHVQAWQRGDFLPQRDLSRFAQRRGFGRRTWIQAWARGGEAYALKEAYAVKDARAGGYFLGMNGDRLTHQSRGFFAGGVREAERLAVAAKRGGSDDEWEVVSVADLHNRKDA